MSHLAKEMKKVSDKVAMGTKDQLKALKKAYSEYMELMGHMDYTNDGLWYDDSYIEDSARLGRLAIAIEVLTKYHATLDALRFKS